MHAILHAQDMLNGFTDLKTTADLPKFLQNYELHIGNDPNYLLNPKCAGGSFLRTDDPASYVFDFYAYN